MAYLLSILLLAAFTLWIPLFIYGIYKIIRKENKKGTYLIIASASWCLILFGTVVLASAYITYSAFKGFRTTQKTLNFKAEEYQGETGEVKLSYGKNATISAFDTKNSTSVNSSGTDGIIKFPVGKYNFYHLSVNEKDSGGNVWMLSVPLYKNFSNVTVSKDKPLELTIAPPFTATVKSSNQLGKDVFDFELKDSSGNPLTISGTTKNAPPKFQLVDSGGKVVFEKSFEYG